MEISDVQPWNGRNGRVTFGEPKQSVVPVWTTLEGTITVIDDEWIEVTPRQQAGIMVAPYPGNGRVRISEIKSIE